MIDSIIFYGAGTKAGTLATAVADMDKTELSRFARKVDGADTLDTSRGHRISIVTDPGTKAEMSGFGMLVSTEDAKIADQIWAMAGDVCRVQFDRESGKVLRTRIPLATLRTLSFEPVPAGSAYAFDRIEEAVAEVKL